MEFRRSIVEQIKNILEKQYCLLLLGEAGTSKSVVLQEIICDYFDNDYEILYNIENTEIKNIDKLKEVLENLLEQDKRILVAVDDVDSEKKYSIFYLIDGFENYRQKRKYQIYFNSKNS